MRRNPDRDHEPARKLLKAAVVPYATGALQKRTNELMKDDQDGPGTSYTG